MTTKPTLSLDEFARNVYRAVPEFLSIDEADAAVAKEARKRHFDAPRANNVLAAAREKARGRP